MSTPKLQSILHIGITVSDLNRAIDFYRDILGLELVAQTQMQGAETDKLFQRSHCVVKLAYLRGNENIAAPTIELLAFDGETQKARADLARPSISEICFAVQDIDAMYQHLLVHNVECLSPPQFFDFSHDGLGKSKAIYFRDPDGTILELMECLAD